MRAAWPKQPMARPRPSGGGPGRVGAGSDEEEDPFKA